MAKHYFNLSKVLKNLLSKKNMRPADLANAVNLPRPTIHRLLTGKSTRPHSSSLQPIADYFSVNIDQLLGEKPLTDAESPTSFDTANMRVKYVPLIQWESIIQQISLDTKDSSNCVPFIGNISEKGFATVMPDTSMEPFVRKNSILIFDPEKQLKDRSYVLVKIKGVQLVFRQILFDVEDKYLKALNSDFKDLGMRLLSKEDAVIGTLLESRINFQAE